MSLEYITKRKNGNYTFRMAIPPKQRNRYGGKREVTKSLGTSDRKLAKERALPHILEWKRKLNRLEVSEDQPITYADLRKFADEVFGIHYRSTAEVQVATTPKERVAVSAPAVAALADVKRPDRLDIATLGGVAEHSLSLDEMFARYEELCSGKWSDLDHRSKQKKWNRYKEPVADFKREMGDMDVLQITPKIAADYAVNLGKRIEAKKIKSETAKKKLLFLNAMVERVFNADYPERANPFEKAKIDHSGDDRESRLPFYEDEILAINKKLSESTCNDQLVAILKIAEYTGCSAKEICLLHESDFFLDEEIPYIRFGPNPNRKSLKTKNRPREVPILGEGLELARKFKKGFPRYCRSGGAEAWGASANSIIQQVVPDKTTYCFRHRMIDLLRAAKTDAALIKWIVGHDGSMTGKYGEGYPLDVKLEAIQAALNIAEQRQQKLKSQST